MREFEGKKILVLGGASQHCKVVETAHRLGVKVYVADYLKDSPAKIIADESYLIDVTAVNQLVELCKKEKIDGAIVTSLEACVLPYHNLCEKMGYPCFGTAEQYKILTNKHLFKECCSKYGVDTISSYSIAQIINDETVEYPVFIKPVDSRGSRGQAICYCKEESMYAIKKAMEESVSGKVMIEKYMEDCPDFTVSYLVVDGEPILIRTGDRFEGSKGSGLENLCIASCSPSKYTERYLHTAHNKVVKMLKGMGLTNAPVFFQGLIDDDKVRFYDPGLRFPGGEYERMLKLATGIDVIEYLVRFALTGKGGNMGIDSSICLLDGKKAIQLDPALKAGKIMSIEGMEEIRSNPNVVCVSPRYKVGEEIFTTNDLRQRFAEFCVLSDSVDEEIKNIMSIQNSLKVIDINGNNMIFNSFTTDNLA